MFATLPGRLARVAPILALSLLSSGCLNTLSVMSALNESMGAQCATYAVDTQVWDRAEGKWTGGYYTDDERWLDRRENYYLSLYTFSTWEETSPAGNRYRFITSCYSY